MAMQTQPADRAERYGRRSGNDASRNHRLRVIGVVLGVLALAGIAWGGYSYISQQKVTAQVNSFDVVDAHQVRITLEVHKDRDHKAVCTVRSRAVNGDEVGRRQVTVPAGSSVKVVTVSLRTTSRGTSGELVGCSQAG